MPKTRIDRDNFVASIDRRRKWARIRLHGRRLLIPDTRPYQEALYEDTFRSDAEAISYHYARRNDHLPDLDDPVWLDEKIRWQFLNHPNPLMSYAADKIAVREYLRFKEAKIEAPSLIASGSDPEELADANLPETFVLKSNFGSGQNHIEKPGMNTPRRELIAKVSQWMAYDQWRQTGELHYRSIKKKWLVEEYISSTEELYDFKVYCFMGEPVFISIITERNVDGIAGLQGTKFAVFDINWRRVSFGWRDGIDDPRNIPRPAVLDQLIEEARRLSDCFMHVRVDFLSGDGRCAFSELTFASMAARVPFAPLSFNERFGDMMKLEYAPQYLELGRSVVALLDPHGDVLTMPSTTAQDAPPVGKAIGTIPGTVGQLDRDPTELPARMGLKLNRSA